MQVVILAAGKGTRMKSDLPKVLHPVAGVPMIRHVLNVCSELSPERIVVVVAPNAKEIELTGTASVPATGDAQTIRSLATKAAKRQAVVAGLNRVIAVPR